MSDFQAHVDAERERLDAERNELMSEIRERQARLAELERHYAAVDAYHQVKTGRVVTRAAKETGTPRRARQGSRREEIFNIIGDRGPVSRGDILDYLSLKGDKAGEMSVSNALTALFKGGQVTREAGKYQIVNQGLRQVA